MRWQAIKHVAYIVTIRFLFIYFYKKKLYILDIWPFSVAAFQCNITNKLVTGWMFDKKFEWTSLRNYIWVSLGMFVRSIWLQRKATSNELVSFHVQSSFFLSRRLKSEQQLDSVGSASVRQQVARFKLNITSHVIHAASRGRSNLVHLALEKTLPMSW